MRKILISILTVAMVACTICFFTGKQAYASDSANGYHIEEVVNDKFNKDSLDSTWTLLNDATVEKDYNALHCISPVSYGSGPIFNVSPMTQKTVYKFTINPNSGNGNSNISFNIGVQTPNSALKEPDCDARIQLWDNQLVWLVYQDNLQLPEGDISNVVIRNFSGLYSDLLSTTVSIIIERQTDLKTKVYVEYRRNNTLVYSSESTAFYLNNPRYPNGYCGFFWDCVEMDLTEMEMYNDGTRTMYDDFTQNTLTYSSSDYTLGNLHINNTLNETNVYIAKVSHVQMDNGNEGIKNSYPLVQQKNVTNPYELSYTVKVNELNENSFYGFGFGLADSDTKIDTKNAIGFIKNDNLTANVVVVRNGIVDNSNSYQIALSKLGIGKYQTYTISLDYSNNAYLTINGLTYKFTNIEYVGQSSIGLVNINATKSSNIEMKQFVLSENTYMNYNTEDVSNGFEGRIQDDDDSGFDSPYINDQKYFLGTGVSMDEDWATGETTLKFSKAGPYSGFGYRKQYSEFICEFDFEVGSREKNQFIGLSFGRRSIVDVLMQASTTNTAFMFRCDVADNGTRSTTQVLYGNNAKFSNGSDWIESSVNIYDSENTKYHIMFIAKNRTVYVYYKSESAPDSDMGILRAVIPNVNIDGYVSIVGNNDVLFKVRNYKMVNLLDEYTQSTTLTLRESFDSKDSVSNKLSITGMSKVDNGKLSMNNSTVSTTNEYLYETIRFTAYELQDSFQVMFSKDKKVVFDVTKNQIIVNENGVKTPYDATDVNLSYIKGKRFEITILGNTLTISYKGYYDPQDKLSTPIITYTFETPVSKDVVTFSANGKVAIDDLYLFALDNSIKCDSFDFEEDPNNVNIWQVKKDYDASKVYNPNAKSNGCKSSVGGIALLLPLVGLAVVFAKKREN